MHAGQADCKFGEFAEPAVDLDRAAVLLRDDVIADRETQPGAFAGRLGRKERLEQFVPDLGGDAGAVVPHPDLDCLASRVVTLRTGRKFASPASRPRLAAA